MISSVLLLLLSLHWGVLVDPAPDCTKFLSAINLLDRTYHHFSNVSGIGILGTHEGVASILGSYNYCIMFPPVIYVLDNANDEGVDLAVAPFLETVIVEDISCMNELSHFIAHYRNIFPQLQTIIHIFRNCGGSRKGGGSRFEPILSDNFLPVQLVSLRLAAILGSENTSYPKIPSNVKALVCELRHSGTVNASHVRGKYDSRISFLRAADVAAAIYAAISLSMRRQPVPYATINDNISSFSDIIATEAHRLDGNSPLLYSYRVHVACLLNSLSMYTAAPLSPTAREENLASTSSTPAFRIGGQGTTGDESSTEEVARLVRLAVDSSPHFCPLPSMRQAEADSQVQWMRSHIQSVRSQGYQIVFLCADCGASSVSKLVALVEREDGVLWAWDSPSTVALSTLHRGGVDVAEYQFSDGAARELDAMVQLAVVVVGERLDELAVVDDIRGRMFSRLSTISPAGQSESTFSVVALLWSDSVIVHPVDSQGSGKAFQSFVNVLLLQRPHDDSSTASEDSAPPSQDLRKDMSSTIRIRNLHSHRDTPFPLQHSSPPRARTILLTHMFNEEFLLPHWIAHHASLFDMAILVDYNSTDASLRIVREQAPSSWRVVQSRHAEFLCREADMELMEIENLYPHDWKIVLTVAEFLVVNDLRGYVESAFENTSSPSILRFPSYVMIDGGGGGPINRPSLRTDIPLVCQRSQYFIDHSQPRHWFGVTMYSRFIHKDLPRDIIYGSGRHYLLYDNHVLTDEVARQLAAQGVLQWKVVTNGAFIAKYKWAPWPESVARTLQIFPKIGERDRQVGTPHIFGTEADLERQRRRVLNSSYITDFSTIGLARDLYADLRRSHHRFWAEFCRCLPTLLVGSTHRTLSAAPCQKKKPLEDRSLRIGGDQGTGFNSQDPEVCLERVSSDEFPVDVVYYKGETKVSEKLILRMEDLLQMQYSSLHAENIKRISVKFCVEVLRHNDISLCSEMLISFAFNWVFDMNLAS